MPLLFANSVEEVASDAAIYHEAGFPYVEILCRTRFAMDAIRETHRRLPGLLIGAGTVLTEAQGEEAVAAGAAFIVSPACDPVILEFAKSRGLPMIPGIYTPTDVAVALRYGFNLQKLFPAEISGGPNYLSALGSPFGHTPVKMVVGQGVTRELCPSYLKHPLVGAVIAEWLLGLHGDVLRETLRDTQAWFKEL